MRVGLIAKKLGMTRFFKEDGSHVPVTLLGIEKNYITRIKENSLNNLKHIQIASGNIKIMPSFLSIASRCIKPSLLAFKSFATSSLKDLFWIDISTCVIGGDAVQPKLVIRMPIIIKYLILYINLIL